MVILTLNCGSSSVKYQLYDWEKKDVLGVGLVERIGEGISNIEHKIPGRQNYEARKECPNHKAAAAWIMDALIDPIHGCITEMSAVKAVGHRMVHGAETFTKSVIVSEEVLRENGCLLHPGSSSQPGEHHRDSSGPGSSARCPPLRRDGYRLASDHAQNELYVRSTLPVV